MAKQKVHFPFKTSNYQKHQTVAVASRGGASNFKKTLPSSVVCINGQSGLGGHFFFLLTGRFWGPYFGWLIRGSFVQVGKFLRFVVCKQLVCVLMFYFVPAGSISSKRLCVVVFKCELFLGNLLRMTDKYAWENGQEC